MANDVTKDIDLGITRPGFSNPADVRRAVLNLATGKHYNGRGLRSSATVFWIGAGSRSHAFGLGGGGDFSRDVLVTKGLIATQKNIDKHHAEAFTPAVIEQLTETAKAHYANKLDQ